MCTPKVGLALLALVPVATKKHTMYESALNVMGFEELTEGLCYDSFM